MKNAITIFAVLFISGVVHSEPIVIATFERLHGTMSGGGDQFLPPEIVGFDVFVRPDFQVYPTLLGGAFLIPNNQLGTFNFYNDNASGFQDISNVLTNESEQFIEFKFYTIQPNGLFGGGAGTGGLESSALGGLLTGRTIDHFSLTVTENSIVSNDPNSYLWTQSFKWEIWGEGQPITNPYDPSVPEPSQMILTLIGLIFLVVLNKGLANFHPKTWRT
jgi:hypothetical protein